MTAAINRLSEAALEQLEQHYKLMNKREIVRFLNKNPELLPYLLQIAGRAEDFFQPTHIELSWHDDPEYPPAQNLSMEIIVPGSIPEKELFENLQQFKDDWYWKTPTNIRTKLIIHVFDDEDDEDV